MDDLLGGGGGGGGGGDEEDEDDGGSAAPSIRSPSPAAFKPSSSVRDLMNGDGSLMLFAGNSCSRLYVTLSYLGFELPEGGQRKTLKSSVVCVCGCVCVCVSDTVLNSNWLCGFALIQGRGQEDGSFGPRRRC